jgi:hypothetical protein
MPTEAYARRVPHITEKGYTPKHIRAGFPSKTCPPFSEQSVNF